MKLQYLLAAGLASLAIDAGAVTTAHLRTSSWAVALEDLDSADGVGPSLSWLGNQDLVSQAMEGRQTGWTPFFGLMVPTYGDYAQVQQVTAAPGTLSTVTSAQGLVTSTATNDVFEIDLKAHAGETVSGSVQRMESFTVSAHTQVTLSTVISTAITAGDVPWTSSPDLSFYYQSAGASISSMVYVFTSDGTFSQQSSYAASLLLPAGVDHAEAIDPNGLMSITFANDTDADRTFTLQHQAYAGGNQSGALPAVPEPSSWGLLVAGLLALGVARRRMPRL